VVEEFCETLRRYRVTKVTGDRYAGEWPREQFRKRGIAYEPSDLDASALFRELLPRLNTRTVALLDHPRAINQLASLERRVGRTKDIIDHPHGAKNDIANAIAGVAWIAGDGSRRRGEVFVGYASHGPYGGRITWYRPNGTPVETARERKSALAAGPHQIESA